MRLAPHPAAEAGAARVERKQRAVPVPPGAYFKVAGRVELWQSKTLHVIPRDGRREGAAESLHSTKVEAVERARNILRNPASGQIAIHSQDGRIAAHIPVPRAKPALLGRILHFGHSKGWLKANR